MKTKLFLTALLVLYWHVQTRATKPSKTEEVYGLHLSNKAQTAQIPFKMYGNLIVVPVIVNGSDTLQFVLDTGVSATIITDSAIVRKLKLKSIRKMNIEGVGEGKAISADITIGNTIRMGALQSTYHNIVVMPPQVLGLSEYVGAPIHGIFGYEIFSKFVVTIDFRKQKLTLTAPHKYKHSPKEGDQFPIVIKKNRPYLEGITIVANGKEQQLRVILDTGAGHALMFNTAETNIAPPANALYTQLGVGLAGVVNGKIGRVPKVRIGKYELQDVIAAFPDTNAYSTKISKNGIKRHGNLGGEFLRRFKVTFNYSESYIALKPDKKYFYEAFQHDMSGINFIAQGDGYNQYIIQHIVIGSPAEQAGLKEGDEILAVNGIAINQNSLASIKQILQEREGKSIKVKFRRDRKIINTNLTLHRLI